MRGPIERILAVVLAVCAGALVVGWVFEFVVRLVRYLTHHPIPPWLAFIDSPSSTPAVSVVVWTLLLTTTVLLAVVGRRGARVLGLVGLAGLASLLTTVGFGVQAVALRPLLILALLASPWLTYAVVVTSLVVAVRCLRHGGREAIAASTGVQGGPA